MCSSKRQNVEVRSNKKHLNTRIIKIKTRKPSIRTYHVSLDVLFPYLYSNCSTFYTWSVQKVARILNFRGLRVFDFRFFGGVMLVLISLTCADKFGHFECSVNF